MTKTYGIAKSASVQAKSRSRDGAELTMHYLETLKLLDPRNSAGGELVALDLFAGCGGLSLGFESVGIRTVGIEKEEDCAATYNKNLAGTCTVGFLDREYSFPPADIVIGGPPCQPFSVRGKQLGIADSRDGFPAFINAVEALQPRLFMFENVRGMKFRNSAYLSEIVGCLAELGYEVQMRILNAKHYGVPQNRERLFVVGTRGLEFTYPEPDKRAYTAGEALEDIAYEVSDDDIFLTPSQDAYVKRYEEASKCVNPRDLDFRKPARTLTCRNLAAATSDMQRIRLPDGRRKRLSVREGARLQSFPDWFQFAGNKTSQLYQIGNAVPPMLAYRVGAAILDAFHGRAAGRAQVQLAL